MDWIFLGLADHLFSYEYMNIPPSPSYFPGSQSLHPPYHSEAIPARTNSVGWALPLPEATSTLCPQRRGHWGQVPKTGGLTDILTQFVAKKQVLYKMSDCYIRLLFNTQFSNMPFSKVHKIQFSGALFATFLVTRSNQPPYKTIIIEKYYQSHLRVLI